MSVGAAVHSIEVLETAHANSDGGTIVCTLGREMRFERQVLERCTSSALEELDVDLLVVLAAIAFADRRVTRRSKHWTRALILSIPVHVPELWRASAAVLVSLLHTVSGDSWQLEFRQRSDSDELRQLFLPQLSPDFHGGTIIPYSGGLDSFATLARHNLEHRDVPLLLVHARHGARSLRSILPERMRRAPTLTLPFTISGGPHAEPSYRTRTFLFFSLAALIWRRTHASRIWIGESGTACLGPSFVPFNIEQPVRGCHPIFVKKLADFFFHLWVFVHRSSFRIYGLRRRKRLRSLQRTTVCRAGSARSHAAAMFVDNIPRRWPTTAVCVLAVCSVVNHFERLVSSIELGPTSRIYSTKRTCRLMPIRPISR